VLPRERSAGVAGGALVRFCFVVPVVAVKHDRAFEDVNCLQHGAAHECQTLALAMRLHNPCKPRISN